MKNFSSERFFRYVIILYQYYIPLFVWMSVIFLLSDQPSLGVSGQEISFEYLLVRKTAHVIEYFVLGLLSFRLFRFYFPRNSHAIAAGVVLLALLFALSDEAHQLFVVGRQGKISDVGFDAFGIFLSLVFSLLMMKWWTIWRVRESKQK